jgi:t-SNARE complex subunit (syntaxin)
MAGRPRDPDSFYVEDCRQVQSNTHAIQTLTGQISRLTGTLDSDKDYQHCRKMVDDAVRQTSETRAVLLRIQEHQNQAQNHGERNNRRMMYHKLSDNLAITARVLEDVVRRFYAQDQKRSAQTEEIMQAQFSSPVDAADVAGGEDQPFISGKTKQAGGILDEELQREKKQALQRVDEDMRCLQRIYTDLANTADEQQQSFDSLESHMASAAADIERGREEISMGKYSLNNRMKQKVTYAVASVTAVLVVVGIIASY